MKPMAGRVTQDLFALSQKRTKVFSIGDPIVVLDLSKQGVVILSKEWKLHTLSPKCVEVIPSKELRELMTEATLVSTSESSGGKG